MIYEFTCEECGITIARHCEAFSPPPAPACGSCGKHTARVYGCNIDTSGCKDPDDVPADSRIAVSQERNISNRQA
ncbi:unnamed protein product, partial [marine sediment metagenome]